MFKLPSLLQPIMSNHTLLQRLRDYVSWVIKPEIDRVFTSQIIYIIFSHSSEISHCSPNQLLAFPQKFSKGKYLQLFQGAKSIHTAYVKPSIHNWNIMDHCAVSTTAALQQPQPSTGPWFVPALWLQVLFTPSTHIDLQSFSSLFPAFSLPRLFCIIGLFAQGQFIANNCRRLTHEKIKPTHVFHIPSPVAIILAYTSHYSWEETSYSCRGNVSPHSREELLLCPLHTSNIKVTLWWYPVSLGSELCPSIHSSASQADWISA